MCTYLYTLVRRLTGSLALGWSHFCAGKQCEPTAFGGLNGDKWT